MFMRIFSSLVIIACLTLSGCSDPKPSEIHLSGRTMGTQYNVKYVPVEDLEAQAVQAEIDKLLVNVNKLMSTYDPQSELSLFNQSTSTALYSLSPETIQVMDEAFRIGQLSGGMLDVTLDPVISLWGFGEKGRVLTAPTDDAISEAKAKIGLEKVILSESGATKLIPNLSINLSTVAKGYGVDVVGDYLKAVGINNFLVEIGGETLTSGVKTNGQPWIIAVEKPVSNERAVQRLLFLSGEAIATSGDYRIYFEENGVRYSHLINPKTGKPIAHNVVSVSVIAETCMTADGWATAFNVMGYEEGISLANEQNIAALFIVKQNNEFLELPSEAFKQYMQ